MEKELEQKIEKILEDEQDTFRVNRVDNDDTHKIRNIN